MTARIPPNTMRYMAEVLGIKKLITAPIMAAPKIPPARPAQVLFGDITGASLAPPIVLPKT